jgi:cell division protein FtsB
VRINLLPPELYERQRTRRRTAAVVALGVIVLAALGGFYFLQVLKENSVQADVEAQQAENARLQAEINELQEIDQLQQEIDATRGLLTALLSDRLTGQVGEPGATGTTTTATPATTGTTTTTTVTPGQTQAGPALVGQISFNGYAFTHPDVALWLSRLEDVRGFVNPWLQSSTDTVIGTQTVEQFNSSVDLSEQALARRRAGGGGQ